MNHPLILLTGGLGQLGTAIQRHWDASSLATRYELLPVGSDQLDLTDSMDLQAYLNQLMPRYIINAAAYTQVDAAESEVEAAYAINADAVSNLAQWCSGCRCTLIQVSTDFVFDGQAKSPYLPSSEPEPRSVYGASKLAGELHVLEKLPKDGIIVRTAWLYSEFGNNFVKTMIRLMRERSELSIVRDQIGSPTSAHTLAHFIMTLISSGTTHGTFHWTDGAEISWFDFANVIYETGRACGLVEKDVSILPILSTECPRPATRPAYSVLDRTSSLAILQEASQDWRLALASVITNLARAVSTA